jgi:short-subunit dehydrogenase
MKKTVVITGISGGIGKALVERLARIPTIQIVALSRGKGIDRLPPNVKLVRTDITNLNRLARIVSNIETRYSGIDVLINNAGNGMRGSIEDTSMDEVAEQLAVNVWPTLRLTQLVLPGMRARRAGHIITISSMASAIDYPTLGYYGAAKAFVEKVHRTLAHEVAPWNIAVSAVLPGAVKTNFGRSMTNVKKYGKSDYTTMYKIWGQKFANLFKHPSTSEQAADVIVKLLTTRRPLVFLRKRDWLAYQANRLSRSFFHAVIARFYMR